MFAETVVQVHVCYLLDDLLPHVPRMSLSESQFKAVYNEFQRIVVAVHALMW